MASGVPATARVLSTAGLQRIVGIPGADPRLVDGVGTWEVHSASMRGGKSALGSAQESTSSPLDT